jgi:hypothetical protein
MTKKERSERYLNDPVFCKLVDWMVRHVEAGNFTINDLVSASKAAAAMFEKSVKT